MHQRVRLCHMADVVEGSSRGFSVTEAGGRRTCVFVVKRGGQVWAYVDLCPHLQAPMAWRKDAYLNGEGTRIVCSAHGALFDISTGRGISGPALGLELTSVPIEVNDEGMIYALIEDRSGSGFLNK